MNHFLESLEDYFNKISVKYFKDEISNEKYERLCNKLDEWEEHAYYKEEN